MDVLVLLVDDRKFTHPFDQVFMMFIGESLSFFIFLAYKRINWIGYQQEMRNAKYNQKQTKFNPLLIFIPALFDMFTSTFVFLAIQFMPTSVYSMVRATSIVVTGIFQEIFLKHRLYRHQVIGMAIILVGNIIVGLSVYFFEDDSVTNTMLTGLFFLMLSFFSFSAQIIVEEKYFNKYYLNPLQLVGIEGLWGLLISGFILTILQFIPCPEGFAESCPQDSQGHAYFAQSDVYFEKAFSPASSYQPNLALSILGGVLATLALHTLQATVTKYFSALTQNVIQVTSISIVWLVSLLLGWETFLWAQLLGFFILVLGYFMFRGLLILSCLKPPRKEILLPSEEQLDSQDESQIYSRLETPTTNVSAKNQRL